MILGSIVLAGGPSSRMGRPKDSLEWGDESLLLHTVTTLLDCCYPVVVVARDDHQDLPPLHTECDLIFDPKPGEGPLPAIEAGMKFLEPRCDAAFVTGCDLPFLTSAAVSWLAEQLGDHSGLVPVVGDFPQPLCGIYHIRLLPTIHAMAQRGERRARALTELPGVFQLAEDRILEFDPELRFCRDVDTPEEYDAARRESGQD